MSIRDWEIITSYVESVGTTSKTFSFNKTQNFVKLTNKGKTNLTYTIGSQSGTLPAGQSKTVSEKVNSYTITSTSGVQPFEIYATEDATEKEDIGVQLPNDVGTKLTTLESSLAQKAKQTDLDTANANIALKANKTDVFTMANMGQDIKTAMTGGSVAVVGVNALLKENIVNKQVTPVKTSFVEVGTNLYNPDNTTVGQIVSGLDGSLTAGAAYTTTEHIPVTAGQKYTVNSHRRTVFYNLDYTFNSFVDGDASDVPVTMTAPVNGYMRVSFLTQYATETYPYLITASDSRITYEAYQLKLKNIKKVNYQDFGEDAKFQIKQSKDFTIGKNKIDLTAITNDSLLSLLKNNYYLQTNTSYFVTDFIPIKSGVSYTVSTCRNYVLYDDQFKPQSIVDNASRNPATFTPSASGYVRFSIDKTVTTPQFEEGTVVTAFEPFTLVAKNKLKVGQLDVSIRKDHFDFYLNDSKNLFIESKASIGYINSGGTTAYALAANSNYFTTDYIPIKSGFTYSVSRCRNIYLFNLNKAAISVIDNASNGSYTFTAAQDGFVRVSCSILYQYFFQFEVSSVPTSYQSNAFKFGFNEINNIEFSPLFRKTLVVTGDSIAYGAGNEINPEHTSVAYGEMIAKKHSMTLKKYAVSGTTVSRISGSTSMLDQIPATDSADYVLLEGLTNDASAAYTLGAITSGYTDSLNEATFYGAMESYLKKAISTYKGSKILYVIPHNMKSRGITIMEELITATIKCCKKWSIPYIDLFHEGGMNTNIAEHSLLYTFDTYSTGLGDGTHPNKLGYETYYVPQIEARMKLL